ncbi:MAG: type I glyceraldehyde-3-phosphate dehydrogenase [Candidatus Omnitrophica bacterium]|nr:type I glyceraldehyde-3-phosphate dehydrogenase [Candidatus Omnitrophota bacterium]MBD3268821.1 type I glyceraldehyde-3-phosphate dehydrogenase [Candidatus Omnitrophota bacterium]
MAKVAINGLGRIGRATLKIVMGEDNLDLVAVNDLVPVENLVYLLRQDSVYGRYERKIEARTGSIVIDGKEIKVFSSKDPSQLPWKDLGIDVVFECTGIFTKGEDLKKHIEAGAKNVILSAPAKSEDVPTVVHGVNTAGEGSKSFSCASCTTNCITPVVEIMKRRIGIKKAIMTTIHAYTSTQNIVDGPSKKLRRGRAAAVNFVPTSTGAAKATAKALPELKGKFNGIAVRGPVPVGSVADIVFVTERDVSEEEVNKIFKEEAASDKYKSILGVSEESLVSTDIIKDPRASVVDLEMTQVVDGNLVKVISWYDNEWGYSSQMVKEARRISTKGGGE